MSAAANAQSRVEAFKIYTVFLFFAESAINTDDIFVSEHKKPLPGTGKLAIKMLDKEQKVCYNIIRIWQ